MAANLDNAPGPRLCHVIRWADFDGYGFNLHSDKTRNGQFIGKVDLKSPAEAAGLKQGDRIVEVNGINIANENHKQVVERIKAIPKETRLLVVDTETDAWYRANKVVVRGTQKNVIYLQNPATRDAQVPFKEATDIKNSSPPTVFTPDIHYETVIPNRKSSIEPPSQSGADGRIASPVQASRHRSSADDELIENVTTENLLPTLSAARETNKSPVAVREEKRPSITFSEHAPVTTQIAPSDEHDKHSVHSEHEDVYHLNHAHNEKSGHTHAHGEESGHDHAHKEHDHHDHHPQDEHDHVHHPKDEHDHVHHPKDEHDHVHHHHTEHNHEELSGHDHAHNPTEGHSQRPEFSEPTNEGEMKEIIHETRIISDGQEADRLASQLTGYRVLGEEVEIHAAPVTDSGLHGDRRASALADGTRGPHTEHVHFENGTVHKHADGTGVAREPSPRSDRREVLEERVVHSPAFSPSTPVLAKEEVSEKVEVHKQNGSARNYSYNIEPKRKDSMSEDSGSRSLSSAETHSDKENGPRRIADDTSDDHDSKTPSPSPAVVVPMETSRSATSAVRPAENGFAKPFHEKEKAPSAAAPKASSFGNLALNVSVQEMRATLSRKKKADPRNQQMDLRKKLEFIDNM